MLFGRPSIVGPSSARISGTCLRIARTTACLSVNARAALNSAIIAPRSLPRHRNFQQRHSTVRSPLPEGGGWGWVRSRSGHSRFGQIAIRSRNPLQHRRKPVCPCEPHRQVHDSHRLTHVEHVHRRVLARLDRGRLDHQHRCLVDRHEIPRHPRIRHRDRPALRNLRAPDRKHAARAPQHIAEAHHAEARRSKGRPASRPVRLPVQTLRVHLRQPLGRAHHARRVHRLVAADQDKPLRSCRKRRVRYALGAEQVVRQRVRRMVFHQGHMLVRGRVENHIGLEFQ